MAKAKIEHELLDSKMATAVALFNEWIKWCDQAGISRRACTDIPKLFLVDPSKLEEEQDKLAIEYTCPIRKGL